MRGRRDGGENEEREWNAAGEIINNTNVEIKMKSFLFHFGSWCELYTNKYTSNHFTHTHT